MTVHMTHPDDPAGKVADVTDEAFELIWKPKGWIEADPAQLAAAERAEAAAALGVEPGQVPTPTAPAKSAGKAAWVDWAVLQGADRDQADALTRDDLIARYGPTGEGT